MTVFLGGAPTTVASTSFSEQLTLPKQPCFLVQLQTTTGALTGDGTVAPVQFDTTVFDQGTNVTLNSSGKTIFTAPTTGKYHFDLSLELAGTFISSNGGGQMRMVATSRNYIQFFDPNIIGADGSFTASYSALVDMTAGDTIYTAIYVAGSVKDTTVQGNGSTVSLVSFFGGYLVC